MTIEQAEMRQGIEIRELRHVDTVIADSKDTLERAGVDMMKAIDGIKETVL